MKTKNNRHPSLPNILWQKFKIQWNYWTTWQGSSHFSPLHPGAQVQVPSRALQAPPLRHWQVRLQPSPHVPLGQFMEQSTPCQPAKKKGDQSQKLIRHSPISLRGCFPLPALGHVSEMGNTGGTFTTGFISSFSWGLVQVGRKVFKGTL